MTSPPGAGPEPVTPEPVTPEPVAAGGAPAGRRPRSRVVLWTSLGVAVVIGVFIAVLAAAKPSADGNSSSLIGKAAPDVSGPALNSGGSYSLTQYRGKWVLVNFAASWCVPCRQETPQLQRFAAEHTAADDGVVLGVAFDPSDVGSLASYMRSSRSDWPAVDDPSADVPYGVTQIPQSYLVDPAGTVVAKFFGALTAAQVDKVIGKATASG